VKIGRDSYKYNTEKNMPLLLSSFYAEYMREPKPTTELVVPVVVFATQVDVLDSNEHKVRADTG